MANFWIAVAVIGAGALAFVLLAWNDARIKYRQVRGYDHEGATVDWRPMTEYREPIVVRRVLAPTAAARGSSAADAGHHDATEGWAPAGSPPALPGPGGNPRHGSDETATTRRSYRPQHAATGARDLRRPTWRRDTELFAAYVQAETGVELTAVGPPERELHHTRSYMQHQYPALTGAWQPALDVEVGRG